MELPGTYEASNALRYISPLMRPPSMKRLSPSLPDGPSFFFSRRSVVGSISNRGRNYEPARLRSFCGEQNLKSHGVPRLIGGTCRCIAAHVLRLPRLTLKAGRKAGCKAGPRGTRGPIPAKRKLQIRKIEISKIANRKNRNLENFHRNVFHEIDRAIVSHKIAFLFPRSAAKLFLFAPCPAFAKHEVQT
jgi:hypothetical protein